LGPIVVVLVSQAAGFVPLILALALIEEAPARAEALWWGGGAGVVGGTGVGLLYRGLAEGRMSVVAPVTGVVAAAMPVLFGLGVGERPGGVAMGGVLCALGAVVLISRDEDHSGAYAQRARESTTGDVVEDHRSGIGPALGAGASFGMFFILLERAGDGSGLWPILASRTIATSLFLIAAAVTRTSILTDLRSVAAMAIVGVLDVSAITLYVYATRQGLLSLVAVLASMYPAMTVLLARTVLKERFVRSQRIGLVLAAAGIGLIALG
jgi:drug/metabolite transporter (DMT)-like permease